MQIHIISTGVSNFSFTSGGPYLSQLWGLDLLNLEEVTDGQKGDGHSTDADHKNDQGRTVVDVASEVFYRVQQVHLHRDHNNTPR